ncbi:hypothetical protein [Lysinibacillus fusiformis]|uniref:hypothetical protein n=1 Tax=Lysinibacillus fusiformis TaxID=28031 RepID=UPI00301AA144
MENGACNIEKVSFQVDHNDFGEENLQIDEEPLAGTEDFSYTSQRVTTMFMWAGSNSLGNQNYPLHNPNIILDEGGLPLGVAVVVHSAINWLNASHH